MLMKEMVRKNKVQIALLQESKINSVSGKISKELWASPYVEWVVVDAVGSADGIIVLRDSRFVTLLNKWKDVFSASVLDC